MQRQTLSQKKQGKFKALLIWLFLLFSVIPLSFVVGYSFVIFRSAFQAEVYDRLNIIAGEINFNLEEKSAWITDIRRKTFRKGSDFFKKNSEARNAEFRSLLSEGVVDSITYFTPDGFMQSSVFRDANNRLREYYPKASAPVRISEDHLKLVRMKNGAGFIDYLGNKQISISYIFPASPMLETKADAGKATSLPLIEMTFSIKPELLNKIQKKFGSQLVLLTSDGTAVLATNEDFYLYEKDSLKNLVEKNGALSTVSIRGAKHFFSVFQVPWAQQKLLVGISFPQQVFQSAFKKVTWAIAIVVLIVIGLVIMTTFLVAKRVVQPIDDILEAFRKMPELDSSITLPIEADTEIGQLVAGFNKMSEKVATTKADLKKKISELENANEEIKSHQTQLVQSAKMISLGQLVAGVAHELNNPIGFIYSNMAVLKESVKKLLWAVQDLAQLSTIRGSEVKEKIDFEYLSEDLPKLIQSCETGAKRTKDIVVGLRNFSRIDRAIRERVDIHDLLEQTLALLEGEIKNRIEVIRKYSDLPLVECYPSQLNQVFMNITANAIQAIEGEGKIWITTRVTEKDILVLIQDSGKGMAAHILSKIFDPFFSTKGVGQGTGLGLSISYGIVKEHGGEIHVTSQVGVGTEFTIRIPKRDGTTPSFV